MNILNKFLTAGLIPVVVIENAVDAVPTANALLAGGLNVMEITFRTAAAPDAIKAVAENCPDMLVGAGTVITLEQCKKAVQMGAQFIVSPGFDKEIVAWCIDKDVPVIPGCITPTEIMAAIKVGLKVLKFFPADVYGGLSAMKSLSGPFDNIKFIPTGGINTQNIGEYISSPYVHAVGGSWICPKADINANNFEKITALCEEARKALLGYEVAHIGVNTCDSDAAQTVVSLFSSAFHFPIKDGNSSVFASPAIEVMKNPYLGKQGHLAIRTNRIDIALADLEKKGYVVDMDTAKYKGDKMVAVYLKDEIGGFAIHLLQK